MNHSQMSHVPSARLYGGLRPVYIWRVIVNGQVYDTVDPTEVAILTRQYPHAIVQVIPAP